MSSVHTHLSIVNTAEKRYAVKSHPYFHFHGRMSLPAARNPVKKLSEDSSFTSYKEL